MKVVKYIWALVFALTASQTKAQQVIVKATLDTTRILIGDQVRLRLSVEKPASTHVIFPQFKDTLTGKVEIISISPIDTTLTKSKQNVLRQDVLISVFDTGLFEIPAIPFVVKSIGSADTLVTVPAFLQVMPVKTDSTIRDIKAIDKVPISFRETLPYDATVLILAILGWLIFLYFRNRKSGDISSSSVPSEPAEVIALRDLEQLENEKPWLNNKTKYYYIRIAEILRVYIERRFMVTALEQTTDEIIASLRPTTCATEEVNRLSGILRLADLVKFAKVIPGNEENAVQIVQSKEFINRTTAAIPEVPESKEVVVQNNRQL
jgi:hypothetical protein